MMNIGDEPEGMVSVSDSLSLSVLNGVVDRSSSTGCEVCLEQ